MVKGGQRCEGADLLEEMADTLSEPATLIIVSRENLDHLRSGPV